MNAPLTRTEREQLAQRMQAQRDQLARRLQAQLAGGSRADHAREVLLQDGDDAPQRSADREVDFALTDLEAIELAALDAALQRLAEGGYGQCLDCGADIPLARLEVEPQAPLCVGCQSAHERGRTPASSL